jgi:hypothetical protein
MSKKLIPIVIVVAVAVIVVLLVGKKSNKEEMSPIVDTETSETEVVAPAPVKKKVTVIKTTEAPASAVTEENVTEEVELDNLETTEPVTVDLQIFVNDQKANISSFEVNKGDTVRLTLTADPRNNYRGGLEFTSGVLDPIRLLNGQSVMVNFVAKDSFAFTPHWPGNDTPLPYKINIIVK